MEPLAPSIVSDLLQGFLVFLRTAPLVFLPAVAAGRRLPWPVGMAVSLGLALFFFSILPPARMELEPFSWPFAALAAREAFIGVVWGVLVAVALSVLQTAVRIGVAMLGIQSSPFGEEAPLESVFVLFGVTVFLWIGGPHVLLWAVGRSFETLPVGGAPGAMFARPELAVTAAGFVGDSLASGFVLSLPVVTAVLMADLASSMVTRSTGIGTAYLEPLARMVLGLLVLAAAVALGFPALDGWMQRLVRILMDTAGA